MEYISVTNGKEKIIFLNIWRRFDVIQLFKLEKLALDIKTEKHSKVSNKDDAQDTLYQEMTKD